MKRSIPYLFILLLTVGLVGCFHSKNDYVEIKEIGFNPFHSINTRSGAEDSVNYAQNKPFGVWAYALPVPLEWNGYAPQSAPFCQNERVVWNGTKWSPSTDYLWPLNMRLTFFAYSPYSDKVVCSKEKGICLDHINIKTDTIDRLFTHPLNDLTQDNTGGTVQIPFISAFCTVEFRAQTVVPDNVQIRLKRLSISNVAFEGSFQSLPEPVWGTEGTSGEKVVYDGGVALSATEQLIGNPFNMIPQRLTTTVKAKCDITVDGSKLTDQVLESQAVMQWGVGKRCIYTLKLSVTNMTFTTDILNK